MLQLLSPMQEPTRTHRAPQRLRSSFPATFRVRLHTAVILTMRPPPGQCMYVLPVMVPGAVGTITCSEPPGGPMYQWDLKITLGSLDLETLAVLGQWGAQPGGAACAAAQHVVC